MTRLVFVVAMALGMTLSSDALSSIWPSALEEIASLLEADDASERRHAASRLRELAPGLALPLVLRVLQDDDREIRLAAAHAAIELRLPGAGDKVVAWLGERDARLRLTACEVIRTSPSSRARAPLARALGDASAEVRLAAADTLGVMGDREAVGSLLGHLDDASAEVRATVVVALGKIGDPRAVVPLLGKVQDASADVRRVAIRTLGELQDPRASSVMLLALRDKTTSVQIEAIEALGRLRAVDAVAALAPLALDASQPRVRRASLMALSRIRSDTAIETLLRALASDDPNVERSEVRDALVEIGVVVTTKLVMILKSGASQEASSGAALVLAELGQKQHVTLILDAIRVGRIPAGVGLRALAILRDPQALPDVLELLASPTPSLRRAAIDAASELIGSGLSDGRAIEPIAAQLQSFETSPEERASLVALLGHTGSPRAIPLLVELAKSTDTELRAAAFQALGFLGNPAADAVLLEALDDPEPGLRLLAALSLAKTAGCFTLVHLLHRAAVASEQDRGAIGLAISGGMSRCGEKSVVKRVQQALGMVDSSLRDALIEGLGRMKSKRAGEALARLATGVFSADDRRKVAEALAEHPEQVVWARKLMRDPDPAVQANATWSIGHIGDGSDLAVLKDMIGHIDVAVAGNAIAAIGVLGARGKTSDLGAACVALAEQRPYLRANALGALRIANRRCGDGARERSMTLDDTAPIVRARAATLLMHVASSDPASDARVLRRCALDDPSGMVALACKGERKRTKETGPAVNPVDVFVVPDGASSPMSRSPYALVFDTGLMRLGIADRRGIVFEARAPRGDLSLAAPAFLVR